MPLANANGERKLLLRKRGNGLGTRHLRVRLVVTRARTRDGPAEGEFF